MKLFKTLFGLPGREGDHAQQGFEWVPLTGTADLDHIDAARAKKPQVLFKHSTSCGLSGMMLRRFEKQGEMMGDEADFYLLDLIRHRELSNEVARRYAVPHQSPQLLILDKNGVREHASHGDIGAINPLDVLKNPA